MNCGFLFNIFFSQSFFLCSCLLLLLSLLLLSFLLWIWVRDTLCYFPFFLLYIFFHNVLLIILGCHCCSGNFRVIFVTFSALFLFVISLRLSFHWFPFFLSCIFLISAQFTTICVWCRWYGNPRSLSDFIPRYIHNLIWGRVLPTILYISHLPFLLPPSITVPFAIFFLLRLPRSSVPLHPKCYSTSPFPSLHLSFAFPVSRSWVASSPSLPAPCHTCISPSLWRIHS